MGFWKQYFNDLLCECAPENGFAQDAIETATVGFRRDLAGIARADGGERIGIGDTIPAIF